MHLVLVSITYKNAPVEVREKLSFSEHCAEAFLGDVTRLPRINEAYLLSTCNRTELLVHHSCKVDELSELETTLCAALCKAKGVSVGREYFVIHHNIAAVEQVFRIAAGLESMVTGESQIFGQLKNAYKVCSRVGAGGFMINKILHKAFTLGKSVRTDTEIAAGISSISHAAALLASAELKSLSGRNVIVIGAGEMGRITAKELSKRTKCELTIVNRNLEKAQALAEHINASFKPFDELSQALEVSDVIVTATRCPEPLITRASLEKLESPRKRVLIDIGVPRNICKDVQSISDTTLFCIDDLRKTVDAGLEKRNAEVVKVEAIIADALEQFTKWYDSQAVEPVIKKLIAYFEKVHQEELNRVSHHFSEAEREKAEMMSRRLVNKLLHKLIKRMKSADNASMDESIAGIISEMFDLDMSYSA